MAKYRSFKKIKPDEPIPVTARQLESFRFDVEVSFRDHKAILSYGVSCDSFCIINEK